MGRDVLMNEYEESARIAVDWLINSRIHNSDETDTATFGSFNKYYDLRKKNCPCAYTEITAYAIELLLDLFRRTNDQKYYHTARLAGEWIGKMQYDGTDENAVGGFLECLNLAHGSKAHSVYSFDTAIIIGALSDLYKKTGVEKYLRLADESVKWLFRVMRNSDCSFKAVYDLNTKSFSDKAKSWSVLIPKSDRLRDTWYRSCGCHHGKMVIGLLKYYSIHEDPQLLVDVRSLLKCLLSQQDREGYFKVTTNSNAVFLHTHCYAAEGLLYSYSQLGDAELYEAARKAGDWLIKIQRSDGSLPAWFNNGQIYRSIDSSAVAQAIRIWSVLYSGTGDMCYYESIKKALRYLLSMQCTKLSSDMLGGFYLVEFDFKLIKYRIKSLYSWPTMFAIHALNLANDTLNREVQGSELW
jgi:uncharacterized protein YyaL (SSP411 family)